MTSDLDALLGAAAKRAPGYRLDQLEAHVWARISALRGSRGDGLWGWRAATLATLLVIGVLSGGAISADAQAELSPFSTHATLAPSTLLEGGR